MDKKELLKLISSFVIGDGALSNLKRYGIYGNTTREKNSKYYIKQRSIHKDYIDWQASILSELTSLRVTFHPAFVDSRGYKCNEQIHLSTKCHPFYTDMRNNFYMDNKKVIVPHYLKLWDAQSLAILYMDNGWLEKTVQKSGNIYYRVGIATNAYSYGDVMLLKRMIKEKFQIEFDIQKQKKSSGNYQFYLRNSKNNSLRFIDLVEPYMFPSFKYKIEKTVQPTPSYEGEDIV